MLTGLNYDTTYYYSVTGPGISSAASFRSRTKSGQFSFLVEGDEGFFPAEPGSPPTMANYEGRIAHLMYNVKNISLPGQAPLPSASFALNTGDNVYNEGSEGSYRDFWLPVWNSDTDSVNKGAPFVRSIPYYIVAGNHDIGGAGDHVNMLATGGAGKYTGSTEGGDALSYYNDFYFPAQRTDRFRSGQRFRRRRVLAHRLLVPVQRQILQLRRRDSRFRSSTVVDTGKGVTPQIDHMSNYFFDHGNAHFLFLNSNPRLFNAQADYSTPYSAPPVGFTPYPSALREWIANDLDSSWQPWKIVVYHHFAFSSGDATQRNYQMRAISKLLEDHGVNIVFNGHEHNYQRTYPIRSLPRVAEAPTTLAPRAVITDPTFDGISNTVPDGVLHIIEGAGGNRDFDGAKPTPRGQGSGLDQEDMSNGTYDFGGGLVFPQGPSSWLDTH
ncbi:MAG TPA: metallophosphoesterase [Bryobacteraceae bacterium]|nr:metallophosphoesterase [Bryobacteraceae bacterium]